MNLCFLKRFLLIYFFVSIFYLKSKGSNVTITRLENYYTKQNVFASDTTPSYYSSVKHFSLIRKNIKMNTISTVSNRKNVYDKLNIWSNIPRIYKKRRLKLKGLHLKKDTYNSMSTKNHQSLNFINDVRRINNTQFSKHYRSTESVPSTINNKLYKHNRLTKDSGKEYEPRVTTIKQYLWISRFSDLPGHVILPAPTKHDNKTKEKLNKPHSKVTKVCPHKTTTTAKTKTIATTTIKTMAGTTIKARTTTTTTRPTTTTTTTKPTTTTTTTRPTTTTTTTKPTTTTTTTAKASPTKHTTTTATTTTTSTCRPVCQPPYREYELRNEIDSTKRSTESMLQKIFKYQKKTKSSTVNQYFMPVLVAADKSFLQFHGYEDYETYILTVMNMVADYFYDLTIGFEMYVSVMKILYLDKASEQFDFSTNAKDVLDAFCQWTSKYRIDDSQHPHKFDVAILITRRKLEGIRCTNTTIGVTYTASACLSNKACVVVQDTGLLMGVNIAHQLGHLLGAPHDDGVNGACQSDTRNGSWHDQIYHHIMSPHLGHERLLWSVCSKAAMAKFMSDGLGSCLEDRPPASKHEYPKMLPGVMYPQNAQCSFRTKPGTKACTMNRMDACKLLFCDNGNGTCISRGEPAAGTPCASNKWCFNLQCVHLGMRPHAINGEWGEWEEWGPCSRTCGGGVKKSRRYCNNPPPKYGGYPCRGESQRLDMCNLEACDPHRPSFRASQCAHFNRVPISGTFHKWRPVLRELLGDPCGLYCANEYALVARLLPYAVDGTPCRGGANDLCIDGKCVEVGCDWNIGSDTLEDHCGICGGDGTACRTIENWHNCSYNLNEMSWIANIPIRSRNILVYEARPSENHLGIATHTQFTDSVEFVIGGSSSRRYGEFLIGHIVGFYGQLEPRRDYIVIKGPLPVDIHVYVAAKAQYAPVFYSYKAFDKEPPISKHFNSKFKREDHEHDWTWLNWTPCSALCDGGTETARPRCVSVVYGLVSDYYCRSKPRPQNKVRTCNIRACVARWRVGPWHTYPNTAWTTQHRHVYCMKEPHRTYESEVLVDPSLCKGKKPNTRRKCKPGQCCFDNEHIYDVRKIEETHKYCFGAIDPIYCIHKKKSKNKTDEGVKPVHKNKNSSEGGVEPLHENKYEESTLDYNITLIPEKYYSNKETVGPVQQNKCEESGLDCNITLIPEKHYSNKENSKETDYNNFRKDFTKYSTVKNIRIAIQEKDDLYSDRRNMDAAIVTKARSLFHESVVRIMNPKTSSQINTVTSDNVVTINSDNVVTIKPTNTQHSSLAQKLYKLISTKELYTTTPSTKNTKEHMFIFKIIDAKNVSPNKKIKDQFRMKTVTAQLTKMNTQTKKATSKEKLFSFKIVSTKKTTVTTKQTKKDYTIEHFFKICADEKSTKTGNLSCTKTGNLSCTKTGNLSCTKTGNLSCTKTGNLSSTKTPTKKKTTPVFSKESLFNIKIIDMKKITEPNQNQPTPKSTTKSTPFNINKNALTTTKVTTKKTTPVNLLITRKNLLANTKVTSKPNTEIKNTNATLLTTKTVNTNQCIPLGADKNVLTTTTVTTEQNTVANIINNLFRPTTVTTKQTTLGNTTKNVLPTTIITTKQHILSNIIDNLLKTKTITTNLNTQMKTNKESYFTIKAITRKPTIKIANLKHNNQVNKVKQTNIKFNTLTKIFTTNTNSKQNKSISTNSADTTIPITINKEYITQMKANDIIFTTSKPYLISEPEPIDIVTTDSNTVYQFPNNLHEVYDYTSDIDNTMPITMTNMAYNDVANDNITVDMSFLSQPKPIYVYFPFFTTGQLNKFLTLDTQTISGGNRIDTYNTFIKPKKYSNFGERVHSLFKRINNLKQEIIAEKNEVNDILLKKHVKKRQIEDQFKINNAENQNLANNDKKIVNSSIGEENKLDISEKSFDIYAFKTTKENIILLEPRVITNQKNVYFILETNDIISKFLFRPNLLIVFNNVIYKLFNKMNDTQGANKYFKSMKNIILNYDSCKPTLKEKKKRNFTLATFKSRIASNRPKQRNVEIINTIPVHLYNISEHNILPTTSSSYYNKVTLSHEHSHRSPRPWMRNPNYVKQFKNTYLTTPHKTWKITTLNKEIKWKEKKRNCKEEQRSLFIKLKDKFLKKNRRDNVKTEKFFNSRDELDTFIHLLYQKMLSVSQFNTTKNENTSNEYNYNHYTLYPVENLTNVYFIGSTNKQKVTRDYVILHLYINEQVLSDIVDSKHTFLFNNQIYDIDNIDRRIVSDISKLMNEINEIKGGNVKTITKYDNTKKTLSNYTQDDEAIITKLLQEMHYKELMLGIFNATNEFDNDHDHGMHRVKRFKVNEEDVVNKGKSAYKYINTLLSSYCEKKNRLRKRLKTSAIVKKESNAFCVNKTQICCKRFCYSEDFVYKCMEKPEAIKIICLNKLMHCLSENVYRDLGEDLPFLYIKLTTPKPTTTTTTTMMTTIEF